MLPIHDESAERLVHRARAVVYDGKSGRIVHVHEIRTLDGAPRPAEGAAALRALELARTLNAGAQGVVVSRLLAVETEAEDDIDAETHCVDVETKRLKQITRRTGKGKRSRQ